MYSNFTTDVRGPSPKPNPDTLNTISSLITDSTNNTLSSSQREDGVATRHSALDIEPREEEEERKEWREPASVANDVEEIYDEDEPLLLIDEGDPGDLGSMSDDAVLLTGRPSHGAQILTTAAATLGALSMGTIIGYSSPVSLQLEQPDPGDNGTGSGLDCGGISGQLTDSEISWFSSTLNVGALFGAIIGGYCLIKIGRRGTMIMSVVPFLLGWGLIGFAQNFAMLVAGRVFTGLCCGLVSLSVPTYIGEIASADIRGMLGTGFQVLVTLGVLYAYVLGSVMCWYWLALSCLVPAVLFSAVMILCKESPDYLLQKEKVAEARSALQLFRGSKYNIEPELTQRMEVVATARLHKPSLRDVRKPHVLKPLIISLALMIFQQLSGVNAILFNLGAIFESADVGLSPAVSSIIIASVQVVAALISFVLMDRAGRKLLLLLSAAFMTLSLVAMGVFFYLKEEDESSVEGLGWLPLSALVVYMLFFGIGYGPIPWLMMGELFSADVRAVASGLATLTNWTFSFIVTLLYLPLQKLIKDSGVYWFFASCCAINFVFCLLVVKETKGKTTAEITAMFGGPGADEPRPIADKYEVKRRNVKGGDNEGFEN